MDDRAALIKNLSDRTSIAANAFERFDTEKLKDYFSRCAHPHFTMSEAVLTGLLLATGLILTVMKAPVEGLAMVAAAFGLAFDADRDINRGRKLAAEITSDLVKDLPSVRGPN